MDISKLTDSTVLKLTDNLHNYRNLFFVKLIQSNPLIDYDDILGIFDMRILCSTRNDLLAATFTTSTVNSFDVGQGNSFIVKIKFIYFKQISNTELRLYPKSVKVCILTNGSYPDCYTIPDQPKELYVYGVN